MLVLDESAQALEILGEFGAADGLGRVRRSASRHRRWRGRWSSCRRRVRRACRRSAARRRTRDVGGDHALPRGEPPLRIAPDRAPEERIIIDVIIVAREHEGAERGGMPSSISKPLVATGADCSRRQRRDRRSAVGISVPGLSAGGAAPFCMPLIGIDAQRVLAPALAAVEPLGFRPFVEDEIGIGGIAEGHPRQDAAGLVGVVQAGSPSARKIGGRADRPADDISRDDPFRDRLPAIFSRSSRRGEVRPGYGRRG